MAESREIMEGKKTSGVGRHMNWFVLVLVGIVGYFSYTFVSQQLHLNAIDQDYAAAQARLAHAQEENAALRREKSELEDPAYIEKVARENLGMTRQGELPYISSRK